MKDILNKVKLFVIFWTRIVFVKNKTNVSFINKLKSNFFGGFLGDQHTLYDLNKNNKKDYLSEFDWYKSRVINEPFNDMLNNKVISTEVLKHHIKIPTIYFVKTKSGLTNLQNQEKEVNYNALLKTLKERKSLFLKPISAGQGIGIYLLGFKDNEFLISGKRKTENELVDFLKQKKNWFLSETIIQNEFFAKIYDKTVNTIRIIVAKKKKEERFNVIFAVQRMGTSKTYPVDNASQGGLISKIDLETGQLSVAKSIQSLVEYQEHPDSKVNFSKLQIPQWKEIKKEVLELSNKFSYLNFIAWDVVLDEKGKLIVLESNTSSGVNIIQIWGGQRQGVLGDIYKEYNIIKEK